MTPPALATSTPAAAAAGSADSLPALEARLWQELARVATDKAHAWRIATLATVDAQGEPDARSVVIREVDAEAHHLVFYTDARSPKVAQCQARPRATLVMWSAALGWQLRLKVLLDIETSGLAVSSRWARLKMTPAAFDYLSPLPPGSELAQPTPERGSREHFAVVTAQVQQMDWLDLRREGARRAAFSRTARPRWLAP